MRRSITVVIALLEGRIGPIVSLIGSILGLITSIVSLITSIVDPIGGFIDHGSTVCRRQTLDPGR